jgi:hypothetical protein
MVPLLGTSLVAQSDDPVTSFNNIANGSEDAVWTGIFDAFKNDGFAVLYVRFGTEFSGNWENDFVTPDNVLQWDGAWQHLANLAHNYTGMQIYTVWEPAGGSYPGQADLNQAYPGDAYVDVIGIDIYGVEAGGAPDNAPLDPGSSTDWTILYGMAMASQHGKSFAYAETGAGTDNTTFPDNIAAAVSSSPFKPPVAFMNLWICTCAGNSSLLWTGNPTTSASWQLAFDAVAAASGK